LAHATGLAQALTCRGYFTGLFKGYVHREEVLRAFYIFKEAGLPAMPS